MSSPGPSLITVSCACSPVNTTVRNVPFSSVVRSMLPTQPCMILPPLACRACSSQPPTTRGRHSHIPTHGGRLMVHVVPPAQGPSSDPPSAVLFARMERGRVVIRTDEIDAVVLDMDGSWPIRRRSTRGPGPGCSIGSSGGGRTRPAGPSHRSRTRTTADTSTRHARDHLGAMAGTVDIVHAYTGLVV